jgi:ATP-binding cassette subfamily B protein
MGTLLYAEGDPGDGLYVVRRGRVRELRRLRGVEVSLRMLCAGEAFGHESLLEAARARPAGARAVSEAEVLFLPRAAVDRFLEERPHLRPPLLAGLRSRSLSSFFQQLLELLRAPHAEGRLEEDDLQTVLDSVEHLRLRSGEQVALSEGSRLYLLQTGRALLRGSAGPVAYLSGGDTFGEDGLLGPSPLRLEALSPAHFLAVPWSALEPLLSANPGLREHYEERGREWQRRKSEPASAPAAVDEASAREPAVDMDAVVYPEDGLRRVGRFPFVRQQEQADCGAACLAMVLRHYGKRVTLGRLRDLGNVSSYGASLASLAVAAERLGFEPCGVAMSSEALEGARLPAILHWRGNHFVVLYRLTNGHAWIADPALGRVKISRSELESRWTKRALFLRPTRALEQVEESRPVYSRFLGLALSHKQLLGEVLLCGLVLQVLALALPVFIQQVVDGALVQRSLPLLNLLLMAIITLSVAQSVLGFARSYLSTHVSMKVTDQLLGSFFGHLIRLPVRFFHVRRTGDLLVRFGDNYRVQSLFVQRPIQVILDALMLLGYLALMVSYSVKLSLFGLAFAVPMLALVILSAPALKRLNHLSAAAKGEEQACLLESFRSVESVRALNLQRPYRRRWEQLFARVENLAYRRGLLSLGLGALSGLVSLGASVGVLYLGARMVIQAEMSVGQLMAFATMLGGVYGPLKGFISLWDEFQQVTVALERLEEVLDSEPEATAAQARAHPPRVEGKVSFERVFFRYGSPEHPHALAGVSFEVPAGGTLGIVGRSGSGKTTLSRLLLRLYSPLEGRVRIDDLDLQELDPAFVRETVGVVLQDVNLFSGSILENIAIAEAAPDMQRVEEAARLAEASEFIDALPEGYETRIGEKGVRLSGGQRQRLALARILYRRPQVVVLDEVTSSLDALTESKLLDNLRSFLKDRTTVMISHRLRTVQEADHILVLDRGSVVERGTHAELLAQRGLYAHLWREQVA